MTTRFFRFSAPALLLIGALLASPVTAAAGDDAPHCSAIIFSAADGRTGHPRWSRSFSATQVSDLTFHVLLRHELEGEHLLTLKIFTPHGYLFRTIDVPVKAAAEHGGRGRSGAHAEAMRRAGPGERPDRHVAGYPYPVPVRPVTTVLLLGKKQPSIDVNFPVGGTAIVRNSLYGRWRVVAYFDRAKAPCGPAGSFQLTP